VFIQNKMVEASTGEKPFGAHGGGTAFHQQAREFSDGRTQNVCGNVAAQSGARNEWRASHGIEALKWQA